MRKGGGIIKNGVYDADFDLCFPQRGRGAVLLAAEFLQAMRSLTLARPAPPLA